MAAAAVKAMPDVIATYVRRGDRYVLASTGSMTKAERVWWQAHRPAARRHDGVRPPGPDVVGLLADQTSYGVYGDHGGAQKGVQRIPMVLYVKGMKHKVSIAPFRLVDVLPTVLCNMGIKQMAPMDGTAYSLGL